MAEASSEVRITEDKWVPTVCGGCHNVCGARAHVVNGVVVKIEGMPDSSFGSRGAVCAKGGAQLQVLYDPNRINYPIKRTNPEKGIGVDPKWKRISWDEAMNEIVERFSKIHHENPAKLMVTTGERNGQPLLHWCLGSGIFATAFGATVNPAGAGLYCGNASHVMTGMNHCAWFIAPDFEYGNYVIFFGDVKGVGGDLFGMLARTRADSVPRGMKVVAFDPMCHIVGMTAKDWIPILPGTDLVVALAIANVLVNELGIYDKEYLKLKTDASYLVQADGRFLRDKDGEPLMWDSADVTAKNWKQPIGDAALEGNYTVNGVKCQPVFAVLREHLKQYTPERASEVSTVPADTIRRVAAEFGENARIGSTIEIQGVKLPYRPVSAVQYRAGHAHTNAFHQQMAVDLLNNLVGACDVPGGCLGVGQGRNLGYPDTGYPKFEAEVGKDGFLKFDLNVDMCEWPHREPQLPTSDVGLFELFPCMSSTSPYPWAKDTKELFQRLGIEPKVDALFFFAGNPAINVGDIEAVEVFLKTVPFTVGCEIYHTETTEGFADIVLPMTHGLESLSIFPHSMFTCFNPLGMLDNAFHLRQPTVAPMYERRNFGEFVTELVHRLGITKEWNVELNRYLCEFGGKPGIFDPDDRDSWEEINDSFLKMAFGPEHDLEWFKEHGFITWPKKVEEAYWRWFVDGRAHIYLEFLIDLKEQMKAICEPRGIKLDLEQYTPLISWFPAVIHKEKDTEYDLYVISFTDSLHTGTWTHGIPWLAEVSDTTGFLYTILMNTGTAKEKGIKEGDVIRVENKYGHKVSGMVHTIEGIHPQCIAMSYGTGKWAKGQPTARGKGPNNSVLQEIDLNHLCPISLNMEGAATAKVCKAEVPK